jgi:hypothetical protein
MRVSRPTVLLVLIASIALSFDGRAADWPSCVEGKFKGEIEGGREKLKSETRFTVHDQTVEGTYSFTFKSEFVEGKLLSSSFAEPRSIIFRWEDKFGTGTLVAGFNSDCSEFLGEWKSEGSDTPHSWTGKREEVRADQTY